MTKVAALLVTAALLAVLSGCTAEAKEYDIGPLFPLSPEKCAEYDGDASGEGFTSSCMVTKAECERAVADREEAMREGFVNDAMQFTCD